MVAPIRTTANWQDEFDTIIDVRSPSEFADDHIPGAINLPVLSDAERAEVGTIYKQVSPFEARKLGARLAAENIARHLKQGLGDRHAKGWTPLIYCWRGGQRSGSMARILAEIGWVVGVLDGGYKSYRQAVIDGLTPLAEAIQPMLLQGRQAVARPAFCGRRHRQGCRSSTSKIWRRIAAPYWGLSLTGSSPASGFLKAC